MSYNPNPDALRRILAEIKSGERFGRTCNYRPDHPDSPSGTYFSPVLYPIYRAGKVVAIGWTHYGSSANPVNLNALNWIIRHIFDITPAEFLNRYPTHTAWIEEA